MNSLIAFFQRNLKIAKDHADVPAVARCIYICCTPKTKQKTTSCSKSTNTIIFITCHGVYFLINIYIVRAI